MREQPAPPPKQPECWRKSACFGHVRSDCTAGGERRMPRHSYENRYRAGRILRMQSDEKPQALSADAMRQRLYLLLDDPETVRKGLPGCVITQYQRCRYANCRCRRGQLHGPYYFWYGRMLGWTWKKYR